MLVWIDLETTGLDPMLDEVAEVGLIVTTNDLVELGRWSAVLHVDRAELDCVDPTVDAMHHASGLWAECASSERTFARTMREATRWLEDWRLRHPAEAWHLAGSSVWFDRGFLASWYPELLQGLHHRMLDVSALRLAAETCWGLPPRERGTVAHRAIPDLEASIAELRHWRAVFTARAPQSLDAYRTEWALWDDGCTAVCARSPEEAAQVIREATGEPPEEAIRRIRPAVKLDLGESEAGGAPDVRTAAAWAESIAEPQVCGGIE